MNLMNGDLPYFFVILSEEVGNCCVISYEIAKITEIWRDQDFTV